MKLEQRHGWIPPCTGSSMAHCGHAATDFAASLPFITGVAATRGPAALARAHFVYCGPRNPRLLLSVPMAPAVRPVRRTPSTAGGYVNRLGESRTSRVQWVPR